MQQRAQAVDIALGRCLRLAVLLWRGITRRAKGHRIFRLPGLELACDAEVDQVQVSLGGAHDIGRLEVAEDDRRLARVQVVQHVAQLECNTEHFIEWQGARFSRRGTGGGIPQVLLQRLTFDEVHYQVPVLGIGERIVDLRQIYVFEVG